MLLLLAIILAVGFYFYTYEYLPSIAPPPAPAETGPVPVTIGEINALANAISLTSLNTQAIREPVEVESNPQLVDRAQAMLQRPCSLLTRSWLRNYIAMQETAAQSPGANVRADVGQLYRDWQALQKLYREKAAEKKDS